MATRSDFEPHEWQLLMNAPHLIYSLLTGGADDVTRSEAKAMHKFLEGYQSGNPLVQDVLVSSREKPPTGGAEAAQLGGGPEGSALRQLQQVGYILSQKVNRQEADEYRNFLLTLGRKIAEAASERFLGLGKKVSDEEAQTLDSIAYALKATAAEAVGPGPEGRIYEVKPGDSLSKIALHFYGNSSEWPKIYEANKEQIDNPDLIHPGQKFRIP
ncbi:MAG: LysM peptidoglycan-binding domain-containing protein [bacterium]